MLISLWVEGEIMVENVSMNKIRQVLFGESNFKINSTEEFNKSIQHIVNLLKDAYLLYNNKSYGTSAFLSISVIEEVGKVHMGMYISSSSEKVKKDLLRDHKTKQIIGSNFTIKMGERLQKSIGENQIDKIMELAYEGKLKELRENSIYCDRNTGKLLFPEDFINQELSRSLLLFAIESFDDNLVGYSDLSCELSQKIDEIFEELSNIH